MDHLFTLKDFVVVIAASLGLTLILNANIVLLHIFDGNDVLSFSQSFIVEELSDSLTELATTIFTPNLLTVFFWGVAGLIVYMVTEGLLSGFSGMKEALSIDLSYRHPKEYSHSKFWTFFMLKVLFYIGTAMFIGFWTYLFFTYFLPFSSASLSVTLTSGELVEIVTYGIYTLLGTYTAFMGYIVFWRIFKTYKTRL